MTEKGNFFLSFSRSSALSFVFPSSSSFSTCVLTIFSAVSMRIAHWSADFIESWNAEGNAKLFLFSEEKRRRKRQHIQVGLGWKSECRLIYCVFFRLSCAILMKFLEVVWTIVFVEVFLFIVFFFFFLHSSSFMRAIKIKVIWMSCRVDNSPIMLLQWFFPFRFVDWVNIFRFHLIDN